MASDIKKAYRRAALRHHRYLAGQILPRSENGNDGVWKEVAEEVHKDADRLFKMIGEAYAVISDPVKALDFKSIYSFCALNYCLHSFMNKDLTIDDFLVFHCAPSMMMKRLGILRRTMYAAPPELQMFTAIPSREMATGNNGRRCGGHIETNIRSGQKLLVQIEDITMSKNDSIFLLHEKIRESGRVDGDNFFVTWNGEKLEMARTL
ncbi:hypothetical protein IFM89_016043 [Coptis chinensis]|uniref:J domain-containing protein n=1 Tax=Coptis chinensis TaxID=261450 RepID=A0A835H6C9_9MAGN|nr:hypothetical protein IFM89_016043 [Coptis chinensis]